MKKNITKALSLILVLALALPAAFACGDDSFNYEKTQLTKYISIDREDYVGYDITVNIKKPGELELNEAINKILAKHKSKTAANNGLSYSSGVVENGATVYLRYRGYTLDENGGKVDISGASNIATGASSLSIGSGSFISGFEISLIGKEISDYSKIETVSSGTVKATDMVVVSMIAMYPDGTTKKETSKLINLSDPSTALTYGEEFAAKLTGTKIGEEMNDFSVACGDGSAVYMDLTVTSVIRATLTLDEGAYSLGDTVKVRYKVSEEGKADRTIVRKLTLTEAAIESGFTSALRPLFNALLLEEGGEVGKKIDGSVTDRGVTYSGLEVVGVIKDENKPITIETYFPHNYQETSLRNKTVTFDVYIESIVYYDTPTLTEEFITSTLKIDAESLADYEGEGLVEKYKSKVMEELLQEYEKNVLDSAKDHAWDILFDKVQVKKLPEAQVKAAYNLYYSELKSYYEYYSSYYTSIDEACADYFGTDAKLSAEEAITKIANEEVTQKLIMYYIGREEGFMPNEAEYNTLYNKTLENLMENYLASMGFTRDSYATEEEFLEATKEARASIMENYIGKTDIRDVVMYEYLMPQIIRLANIIKN